MGRAGFCSEDMLFLLEHKELGGGQGPGVNGEDWGVDGYRVQGTGLRAQSSELRAQISGLRAQSTGSLVEVAGFPCRNARDMGHPADFSALCWRVA